jgi:hypothetical protein
MGNWSSRRRLEAFHSRSLIKMSRGGTPQAISSESSTDRHFAASRNDDGLFIKQASGKPRFTKVIDTEQAFCNALQSLIERKLLPPGTIPQ